MQPLQIAEGMGVFGGLILFTGLTADIADKAEDRIPCIARPQREGDDRGFVIHRLQHLFGDAFGLDREDAHVLHAFEGAVDLHRLICRAAPAAQTAAIVAEGGDQTDMRLHRDAFLGQCLHHVERAQGVVHIRPLAHHVEGVIHDFLSRAKLRPGAADPGKDMRRNLPRMFNMFVPDDQQIDVRIQTGLQFIWGRGVGHRQFPARPFQGLQVGNRVIAGRRTSCEIIDTFQC